MTVPFVATSHVPKFSLPLGYLNPKVPSSHKVNV